MPAILITVLASSACALVALEVYASRAYRKDRQK